MKKLFLLFFVIICFRTISFSQINSSTTTTVTARINTPTIQAIKQKTFVESQLMQLNGVISANANLTSGQTYVVYNTGLCNKRLIKVTINSLGHTADELVYIPTPNPSDLIKKPPVKKD